MPMVWCTSNKPSLDSLTVVHGSDVIVPTVGYHFERIVKGNVTLKVVVHRQQFVT